MSKEFKVHEDFNLEHLSWDEENCHCDKPGRKKEAKYWNCESSRHLFLSFNISGTLTENLSFLFQII